MYVAKQCFRIFANKKNLIDDFSDKFHRYKLVITQNSLMSDGHLSSIIYRISRS